MRFLVTGGLGYIGSVITRKLLDRGHSVAVLDKGIFETDLVTEYVSGAEIVREDITDFDPHLLDDADWCFHLGAVSNDGSADLSEEDTWRVNVEGTAKVAEACIAARTQMAFASTASVYGAIEWELSREDGHLNPQSIYARSKVEAERMLRAKATVWEDDGPDHTLPPPLRCIILRQATVFGWSPRMRYDLVVNTLLASAVSKGKMVAQGGGECWRPLVYVGDVADCWIRMAENATDDWWAAQSGCPTFNLVHHERGRTKNYRISELIWWMTLLLNKRGVPCTMERDSMQPADSRSYALDGSRAQHAGYICPTGITDALDEMLRHINVGETADFENPIYRNTDWLRLLRRVKEKAEQLERVP